MPCTAPACRFRAVFNSGVQGFSGRFIDLLILIPGNLIPRKYCPQMRSMYHIRSEFFLFPRPFLQSAYGIDLIGAKLSDDSLKIRFIRTFNAQYLRCLQTSTHQSSDDLIIHSRSCADRRIGTVFQNESVLRRYRRAGHQIPFLVLNQEIHEEECKLFHHGIFFSQEILI